MHIKFLNPKQKLMFKQLLPIPILTNLSGKSSHIRKFINHEQKHCNTFVLGCYLGSCYLVSCYFSRCKQKRTRNFKNWSLFFPDHIATTFRTL